MESSRAFHDEGRQQSIAIGTCVTVRTALAGWYSRFQRPLPWRQRPDPYGIWVSEVMLQQTQVQTVTPYYHRFMARFPDLFSLARADLQSVLKLWEGLGYYSRARHLHQAAGIVAAEMGGRLPDNWKALRALPGIGEYIAAAVLSIAFGQARAVVDGNVKRVLARLFLVDAPVNRPRSHKVFNTLAAQLLDPEDPGRHNQAVMELGALVCTPRSPACDRCPLQDDCLARRKGVILLYPRKDRRRPVPTRRWVAAAVLKEQKLLMVQRPEQGLLGGLWELPGGPLNNGADSAQACAAQLKAALNLDVTVAHQLETVTHAYTHFRLQMELYICRWRGGRVRLNGPARFKWLRLEQIEDLPLHGAAHKALELIKTHRIWREQKGGS
jgi:A/G-specific adenine glycosylase